MSRIYKTTDRITLNIGNIEVVISPLTVAQRSTLAEMIVNVGPATSLKLASEALRAAVKDIKGLTTVDDEGSEVPYTPEFVNGQLTDGALDDLFNFNETQKLSTICAQLLGGFSGSFVDDQGKPLQGVSVISIKPGKK